MSIPKPHRHRWKDDRLMQYLSGRDGIVNRQVIRRICKVTGCHADKQVTRRVRRASNIRL